MEWRSSWSSIINISSKRWKKREAGLRSQTLVEAVFRCESYCLSGLKNTDNQSQYRISPIKYLNRISKIIPKIIYNDFELVKLNNSKFNLCKPVKLVGCHNIVLVAKRFVFGKKINKNVNQNRKVVENWRFSTFLKIFWWFIFIIRNTFSILESMKYINKLNTSEYVLIELKLLNFEWFYVEASRRRYKSKNGGIIKNFWKWEEYMVGLSCIINIILVFFMWTAVELWTCVYQGQRDDSLCSVKQWQCDKLQKDWQMADSQTSYWKN